MRDVIRETADRLGISPSGITVLDGDPYLNSEGVAELMVKKFGLGGFSIKVEQVSNGEGVWGYRATLEIKETGAIIQDEGWADVADIRRQGMKREAIARMMAITRAVNRACRRALGVGMTTVEEVGEVVEEEKKQETKEQETKRPMAEVQADIDAMFSGEIPARVKEKAQAPKAQEQEEAVPGDRYATARRQWWGRIRSLPVSKEDQEQVHVAIREEIKRVSPRHPASSKDWKAEDWTYANRILAEIMKMGKEDIELLLARRIENPTEPLVQIIYEVQGKGEGTLIRKEAEGNEE
jgi:hypothetical protein